MSWTKPIEDPKTWLEQRSVGQPRPHKLRQKAIELCKIYKRAKVAEMLGIAKSTISRWKREEEAKKPEPVKVTLDCMSCKSWPQVCQKCYERRK